MTAPTQGHNVEHVVFIITVGMMMFLCRRSALLAFHGRGTRKQTFRFGIDNHDMCSMFVGECSLPILLALKSHLFSLWRFGVSPISCMEKLALALRAKFIDHATLFALIAVSILNVIAEAEGSQWFDDAARHATTKTLSKEFSAALQHLWSRLSLDVRGINVFWRLMLSLFDLVTALAALATIAIFDHGRFAKCNQWLDLIANRTTTQSLCQKVDSFRCSCLCNAFHGSTSRSRSSSMIISSGG